MYDVGIIDYGMGNIRSVQKGLEKVGVRAELCSEAARLDSYRGLVLPGVGAFGDAMATLRDRGLVEPVLGQIRSGKPLLGICLGMQLLFERSEEHGDFEGLGVIPGAVRRLPDTVKVPHMGWNVLRQVGGRPLFDGIEEGARFYFVHSYYCDPDDDSWTIGRTPYGLEFTCAVGRDNVWGLQFHPEKSSLLGLKMLRNFDRIVQAS
ncbi:MAG: imidazole glycerol phosphate synthase subunit HisH [Actinomycetota bacterium]